MANQYRELKGLDINEFVNKIIKDNQKTGDKDLFFLLSMRIFLKKYLEEISDKNTCCCNIGIFARNKDIVSFFDSYCKDNDITRESFIETAKNVLEDLKKGTNDYYEFARIFLEKYEQYINKKPDCYNFRDPVALHVEDLKF